MAAVRHLGFSYFHNFCEKKIKLTPISIRRLTKFGEKSDDPRPIELLRNLDFQHGGRPPSWIFIFSLFCEKFKLSPISTLSYKIRSRSDDLQPSYCISSIYKMAAVRHLGFGMTS